MLAEMSTTARGLPSCLDLLPAEQDDSWRVARGIYLLNYSAAGTPNPLPGEILYFYDATKAY